jgi:hypothetical protein
LLIPFSPPAYFVNIGPVPFCMPVLYASKTTQLEKPAAAPRRVP